MIPFRWLARLLLVRGAMARGSRLLFAPLLLVVLGGAGRDAVAAGPARLLRHLPTKARRGELDLMTFNVRFDFPSGDGKNAWAYRRGIVARLLRKQRPDVIGVQEALRHQLDDLTASHRHYAAIGEGREGGTEGEYSPIVYRKDRLRPLESSTFWLSPTPEVAGSTGFGNRVPRIATWARFEDRRTGRRFYVYNTHLDHESAPAQARGARLISAHIAARAHPDEPVFLTGDLNVEEDTPVVRALGREMVDTFRKLRPGDRDVGTFNEWGRDTTGKKIDYIFGSRTPGVALLATEIVRKTYRGRLPSDHFPITLRVRLGD